MSEIEARARAIAAAGGLASAQENGGLEDVVEVSLSEALILGLLKQGVSKYFVIFGHGSTDLGEILRIYADAGVVSCINCRNEVAMAHAATALSWQYGEVSAVVTSIGPGALQAMAGSLAALSNGVGVYHLYGDETTQGEGYNMQQIPKEQQGIFGQITALMGQSYVLHTPGSIRECLRRGSLCVHHPYKAGPFYINLPLNTQPLATQVNLHTLPGQVAAPAVAPSHASAYQEAVTLLAQARRPVIKAGGGCRGFDEAILALAESSGAVVVQSPGSTGVLPDAHPLNMHVGGSKGSISGNYAMEQADLLIAIGTRAVCQADCSGVGYPNATAVININGDLSDLLHYANTVGLPGDIDAVCSQLLEAIKSSSRLEPALTEEWRTACLKSKNQWNDFKTSRYQCGPLYDECWGREVLTQPQAIKVLADFAQAKNVAKFFDAGDVQANGFQIVEDNRTGDTFTESGASYMGFAVSALLASAVASSPRYGIAFTGDGSFMMNPQILIDGTEHGVKGMIVLFDNRRMAAISGLQHAQYGEDFRTNDSVAVDYVKLASAIPGVLALSGAHTESELQLSIERAYEHQGLSLVHVPVYAGTDELGGMGAYGSWNVGNWVEDVQHRYIHQKI